MTGSLSSSGSSPKRRRTILLNVVSVLALITTGRIWMDRNAYRNLYQYPFSSSFSASSLSLSTWQLLTSDWTTPTQLNPPQRQPRRVQKAAIVFKTTTIDTTTSPCLCQRFISLVEGTWENEDSPSSHTYNYYSSGSDNTRYEYDVILLHEPGENISQPLLDWLSTSEHARNRVHVMSHPSIRPLKYKTQFFFSPKSKLSFLLWAITMILKFRNKPYSYYWFVEDDVYFTGSWGKFFRTQDERLNVEAARHANELSGTNGLYNNNDKKDDQEKLEDPISADYVCQQQTLQAAKWHPIKVRTCRVEGQSCLNPHNNATIQHSYNNLFRVSHRFLQYLVELLSRNVLWGHDEANFAAALRIMNTTMMTRTTNGTIPARHSQLFPNNDIAALLMKGFNRMGGWAVWRGNVTHPVYSLRGLENVRLYNPEIVETPDMVDRVKNLADQGMRNFKSNMDIPRNKIYHPIKCSADYSIGPAALALAIGEENVHSYAFQREARRRGWDTACARLPS